MLDVALAAVSLPYRMILRRGPVLLFRGSYGNTGSVTVLIIELPEPGNVICKRYASFSEFYINDYHTIFHLATFHLHLLTTTIMSTLANALPLTAKSVAIVIPTAPNPLHITYQDLDLHVQSFQKKLALLGIGSATAVSIALPNSYELVVAFLSAARQRAIAAPLNPAYKQDEFAFYIGDLKSAVILIARDTFEQNGPAVRAARKHNAAIAECDFKGFEVSLDIKEQGKLSGHSPQPIRTAQPDDISLILHTSGTTGRPKSVG